MNAIEIDFSGLKEQFGLLEEQIDTLTELAVNEISSVILIKWEAYAKRELHGTLDEYLQHLNLIDKGRFENQIVLTGKLPVMIEQGASAFDMKEGFKNSSKVKFSIPVYNKKGEKIKKGGEWYFTVPFRVGVPGTLGQAGFSGQMPQEIYDIVRVQVRGAYLSKAEIPSPYDTVKTRGAIITENGIMFEEYKHKNAVFEGLSKRQGVYGKAIQNTYGTFRRAGENSDPMSWIHQGIQAHNLAEKALKDTDVDTIAENVVYEYLENAL